MDNETQLGYLVLADISGYTSYLVGMELDYARDVLTELLELIVQKRLLWETFDDIRPIIRPGGRMSKMQKVDEQFDTLVRLIDES